MSRERYVHIADHPEFGSVFCAQGLWSVLIRFSGLNFALAIFRLRPLSMPKAIITGTVMRDVLPVTTLITLVRKNTMIRVNSLAPDTRL